MKNLSLSKNEESDSLCRNLNNLVMQTSENQEQEENFLASMASHSLPLPQQGLQSLQQQQQQLLHQQEQLEKQLKQMEIEENSLWNKSEQYQQHFAHYQQLLGHQQAQLELQLHHLALHQKCSQHGQSPKILPGSCWM